MKSKGKITIGMHAILVASMLAAGGVGFAAEKGQMSPDLAAKSEMVRKQQDQRITPEKRKSAAEALKAERFRVYQAKQAVKESTKSPKDKH